MKWLMCLLGEEGTLQVNVRLIILKRYVNIQVGESRLYQFSKAMFNSDMIMER